jgi:hypothetical protein
MKATVVSVYFIFFISARTYFDPSYMFSFPIDFLSHCLHTIGLFASLKAGEQKTQFELARAAQITDATIRNRFKDLKDQLGLHY